ncbi:MAG: hypothetical protein JWM11_561 [Planctomycetaceae bacterium]|nr:hypothetical protein [Planctomycetaceae bacterium]
MLHESNSLERPPPHGYCVWRTTTSGNSHERPARLVEQSVSNKANSTELSAGAEHCASGAYEIKFILDEHQGRDVRNWARTHLEPDPHAIPENGYEYAVNSLYLDTPGFDIFHRADCFRQNKYRVRRYGNEAVLWAELKRKQNGRVRKRRTSMTVGDLQSMLIASDDTAWDGDWFRRRVNRLQLRPVCQVTYQRMACVGTSALGPLRLTVDSQLHCRPVNDWMVPAQPLTAGILLPNQQILELKFHETLPNAFRDLIRDLRLTMAICSKYRHSVEACVSLDRLAGLSRPRF